MLVRALLRSNGLRQVDAAGVRAGEGSEGGPRGCHCQNSGATGAGRQRGTHFPPPFPPVPLRNTTGLSLPPSPAVASNTSITDSTCRPPRGRYTVSVTTARSLLDGVSPLAAGSLLPSTGPTSPSSRAGSWRGRLGDWVRLTTIHSPPSSPDALVDGRRLGLFRSEEARLPRPPGPSSPSGGRGSLAAVSSATETLTEGRHKDRRAQHW